MSDRMNDRFHQRRWESATTKVGAKATNTITVNVQLLNYSGQNLDHAACFLAYLSSDSQGLTPRTTSGSLSNAAGTNGALQELATDNPYLCTTNASGQMDFAVTESTGGTTHYLNIITPWGDIITSGALAF